MKSRKSQITVFIILAVVFLIIILIVLFLSKSSFFRITKIETAERELKFGIKECLKITE